MLKKKIKRKFSHYSLVGCVRGDPLNYDDMDHREFKSFNRAMVEREKANAEEGSEGLLDAGLAWRVYKVYVSEDGRSIHYKEVG